VQIGASNPKRRRLSLLRGGVFQISCHQVSVSPSQTPESIHPLVGQACGRKAPCRKRRGKIGNGRKEKIGRIPPIALAWGLIVIQESRGRSATLPGFPPTSSHEHDPRRAGNEVNVPVSGTPTAIAQAHGLKLGTLPRWPSARRSKVGDRRVPHRFGLFEFVSRANGRADARLRQPGRFREFSSASGFCVQVWRRSAEG